MKALRLPAPHAPVAHWVRFQGPRYPPSSCLAAALPGGRRTPPGPGRLVPPAVHPRLLLAWAYAGSLRFPGDPSHTFAQLHDPGRIDVPRHGGIVDAAPAVRKTKASAVENIEAYHWASVPAVYASRAPLPTPMQDSLSAGWLAFAVGESNPLDRDERFPILHSSPFPGLHLTQPRHLIV